MTVVEDDAAQHPQDHLRHVTAAVRGRRSARALSEDAYDEWRNAIAVAVDGGASAADVASAAGTTVPRVQALYRVWSASR